MKWILTTRMLRKTYLAIWMRGRGPGAGPGSSRSLHANIAVGPPRNKMEGRRIVIMQQALRKHIKRNHHQRVLDYPDNCNICGTGFMEYRDDLKEHVRKKHPDDFARLYPNSALGGCPKTLKYTTHPTDTPLQCCENPNYFQHTDGWGGGAIFPVARGSCKNRDWL